MKPLMKKLTQKFYLPFHVLVLIYSIILISMATMTYAQKWSPEEEVNRRISAIENLNLDRRIAVIETTVQDIKVKVDKGMLDYVQSGGVGLILLKFVFEALTKKKGKSNEALD